MTTFLIRRIVEMLGVLLLASAVIYSILLAVPGGPLDELLQNSDPRARPSQADIERHKKLLGLDKPVYLQYVTWLAGDDWFARIPPWAEYAGDRKGIIRGDWGESWKVQRGKPVLEIIAARLPDTLRLMIISTVLSLLIAVPLGIYSAVRQYSVLDYAVTAFSFFGISMPVFWLGLMLISLTLTARQNGWFYLPPGDIVAPRDYTIPGLGRVDAGSTLDRTLHLIMPVTVLCLLNMAGWSRFMRASMLEVLKADFIRTARAKGVRERLVVLKHALRNALIPLITIITLNLPTLFAGAILTETVFNYKALGFAYITALTQKDWPLVMSFLLIQAILIVVSNLIADLLYATADPRIRLA
jgi:peptide/nickel transport system permease protein